MRLGRIVLGTVLLIAGVFNGRAQIDSTKRELIQVGYNQPLQGHGPLSAYAFYYLNLPQFLRTNLTLRLALAPVYLDSELGITGALSPTTDLGIGVAGGGFADSYDEVRKGKFIARESFTGHGGGLSGTLYQRLNPDKEIPLFGILRGEAHSSFYTRDSRTAHSFDLPEDRGTFSLRAGLRYGGRAPVISPDFALEVSAWYEAFLRTGSDVYGFAGDRKVEPVSHLFWTRALAIYTLPEWKHTFAVNLTLGGSTEADRFSAYRLGGLLPMAAEFPLSLPGYYYQEFSARRYVLLGGNYSVPLDQEKRWSVHALAATAGVDYLHGLTQEGRWHTGVGGGFGFRSRSDVWQILVGYAYGVDAIRDRGRGAHAVGFMLQFDLERARLPLFEPGEHPMRSRGLERLFRFQ